MNWMREPNAEPLPGYRLIRPLGTGGFGEVWMCEAPGGILKAIKFVYGNLNSDDGDAARAELEFRALQKVKEVRHPFVLTIERIDVCEGELAIVMELADKSLHDCLLQHQEAGRIGIPRDHVLAYLVDAAEGLDFLGERHNLLHLDVKPRNLFLTGDHVKVADFGLVKTLDRQGASGLMGGMTPPYAAPETFRGDMSKQSDQYSLAIVYMELVTGQRPFTARNVRELALAHMSADPDLRPLSAHDRPIIARALAKDPVKRFPNCRALLRALLGGNHRPEIQVVEPLAVPVRGCPSMPDIELDAATATVAHPPIVGLEESWSPEAILEEGLSRLTATKCASEVGILRPAIILGVGEFGLTAIRAIRSRLLDRLGDLTQTPAFRFLYMDTDPEAADHAKAGEPDEALSGDQVFTIPLQSPGNYRRRVLDHVSEWLPREKLHAIPRSLQPQGSRSLGRLAFSDHYLRFDTRIAREISTATHPESLARTLTHTGLNLRDNSPRIYVIASALGSSSGMLADLGFVLHRRLAKAGFSNASVTGILYCGAPSDPSTPRLDAANLYATLTELHHFQDPAIGFSAQYGGPDGPKLLSDELPFTEVYLLQQPHRGSDASEQCAKYLAGYLVHDLTTMLGVELDGLRSIRTDGAETCFRGFGTAGIWFPRGLMLRSAARIMCRQLFAEWQHPTSSQSYQPIDELCDKVRAAPALQPEAIIDSIEQNTMLGEQSCSAAIQSVIHELHSSLSVASDPVEWSKKAIDTVTKLVGNDPGKDPSSTFLQSRLTRALHTLVGQLSAKWVEKLAAVAIQAMEIPGRRIPAAEETLRRIAQVCQELANSLSRRENALATRSAETWRTVVESNEVCINGSGYRLFGKRPQRNMKGLVTELQHYVQARLNENLVTATTQCYRGIAAGLEDRLRDLSFCRQRLSHLERELEPVNLDGFDGARLGGGTRHRQQALTQFTGEEREQILLPYGERDVEWAAAFFVQSLRGEHWTRLDEVLQQLVLGPLGGLFGVCRQPGDLMRRLAGPLIDQTTAYLGNQLTIGDIASAEFITAGGKAVEIRSEIEKCFERAVPLVQCATENSERAFVVVPGSEAGSKLGRTILESYPGVKVLPSVGSTNDLLVCRESFRLSIGDLSKFLHYSRHAYQELASRPSTSPHARFDIVEWMPIDV